jgi:hypothetical protein
VQLGYGNYRRIRYFIRTKFKILFRYSRKIDSERVINVQQEISNFQRENVLFDEMMLNIVLKVLWKMYKDKD